MAGDLTGRGRVAGLIEDERGMGMSVAELSAGVGVHYWSDVHGTLAEMREGSARLAHREYIDWGLDLCMQQRHGNVSVVVDEVLAVAVLAIYDKISKLRERLDPEGMLPDELAEWRRGTRQILTRSYGHREMARARVLGGAR